MAALDVTTDKLIVSGTGNLGDGAPVDPRVMLAKLLSAMGFVNMTIANIAPADLKTLWWHKDVKAFKRYNPSTGSWAAITADQFPLHLLHRAFTAVIQEVSVADDDWILFWDKSLGESKGMTLAALKAHVGLGGGWTLMSTTTVSGTQSYLEVAIPTQNYGEACIKYDDLATTYAGETSVHAYFVGTNNIEYGDALLSPNSAEPYNGTFYFDASNALQVGGVRWTSPQGTIGVYPAPNGVFLPVNIDRIRLKTVFGSVAQNVNAGTAKLYMR